MQQRLRAAAPATRVSGISHTISHTRAAAGRSSLLPACCFCQCTVILSTRCQPRQGNGPCAQTHHCGLHCELPTPADALLEAWRGRAESLLRQCRGLPACMAFLLDRLTDAVAAGLPELDSGERGVQVCVCCVRSCV